MSQIRVLHAIWRHAGRAFPDIAPQKEGRSSGLRSLTRCPMGKTAALGRGHQSVVARPPGSPVEFNGTEKVSEMQERATDIRDQFQVLHEFILAARRALTPDKWDYMIGAAETETTLKRNRLALD